MRPQADLSDEERSQLENAHRLLHEAVRAYEQFLGRPLEADEPASVHDFEKMARAQAEVEAAERELWQVRGDVLGWPRPPWAPSAAHVVDWFSPEDAIYDEAIYDEAIYDEAIYDEALDIGDPDTGGQSPR
jgi:hypothetical protein